MKIVSRFDYANGDGLAVGILKKAPKAATTKADVIALLTVKKGKKLISEANYFTPDEAMCVAIGLLRAVDNLMGKKFLEFRQEKDVN